MTDPPSLEAIREWTEEPFTNLTPDAIRLLFTDAGHAPETVSQFVAGCSWGSRKGLVYLLVMAHQFHGYDTDHATFAHLASRVWIEGKRRSALAEFGLEDNFNITAETLIASMAAHRCSSVTMSADDIEAFDALPDPVTVWRGGAAASHDLRCGNSWTTSRAVAERFAKLAAEATGSPPVVLWRRARKADFVAYFADRSEAEAVLRSSAYAMRKCWAAHQATS